MLVDSIRRNEGILFVIFIVSQPVIDIATGLSTRYMNSVLSPGAGIRALLLLFILPYIWKELQQRTVVRGLFVSAIGAIVFTGGISILLKQPFLFTQEAVFYMKALYYVAGLFFIILFLQKNLLNRAQMSGAIVLMGLLIGGSYLVSFLTKTSFPSYPSGEMGFSGWFFSANELSVIVLLSFASVFTIARERPHMLSYIALFSLAITGMFIGTKTAYIGIASLLIVGVIELLWTTKTKIFKTKQTFVYLMLALLFFCSIPFVPVTENRAQHIEQANNELGLHVEQLSKSETVPMNNILSSRQDYVKEIASDFARAPMIRKLFGLGYAGDYVKYPKMIEMDFFELFFSFGIIGFITLLLPLLYVIFLIITRTSLSPTSWVLLTGLGLSLAIAAVAGHVLLAPSVMSYIIISTLLLQPKKKRAARS